MTTGHFPALVDNLRRWDGRRRQQELLLWLPRGLAIGLVLALAIALLSRARPMLTRGELALITLALIVASLSVSALLALLRRRSLAEQARFADRHLGLSERMTAAVEIHEGRLPVTVDIAERQLRDALAVAAVVDTPRRMPLVTHPIDWLLPLMALAVLLLTLLLPNPQEAALMEQRAVAATIEQQVTALAVLSEEIAANDSLTPEQRGALQRPVDEALAALEEPGLSREEAVAALSEAEAELRDLSREMNPAGVGEALATAGEALSGNEAAVELAEALLDGQFDQASAAAEALAESLAGLDAEARESLAGSLSEAAEALQDTDTELADSLAGAAGALAEGDEEAAREALGETATSLGERARATAAANQATSTADQLGAAREEVAGAGEPAGANSKGSGENTQGEGQGAGENGEQPGSGGSTSTGQEGGVGSPSEGGGHVENVFVPAGVDLGGEGEDVELDTQCLGDPATCGPVDGQTPSDFAEPTVGGGNLVPYDRVFGDYRDAAFEALAAGDIPLSLQNLVRDYFSALEP